MVRTFLLPGTTQKRKRTLCSLFLGGLAALSACAGPTRSTYRAPGAALNPWGPYIQEASTRFSIPQSWIRAIMQQESGGHQYMHGRPIRSIHGAVGLMQIKPDTYRELAKRYHLGSDPYNPHDNIMAGSGYIRELYDRFGSPGFVAAYNCGPQCEENHRSRGTSLPSYARTYLAAVSPHLNDPVPAIATTTEMAYATAPSATIPQQVAVPASPPAYRVVAASAPATVAVASTPAVSPAGTATAPPLPADDLAPPAPYTSDGDIVVSSATGAAGQALTAPVITPASYTAPTAATVWQQDTGGDAMIQIGAFSTQERALQAAALARQSSGSLASAVNRIELIPTTNGRQIWRTRLAGLSATQTGPICSQLRQQGLSCILVVNQ
ncbi:murein transglycosylase [Acetobacter malorum]|uniref:Murein transglycosylase n=2 Tax=Acetobacter malorum TaxID=178901 RepID=A0A177G630_9PROT|nr:lytic transglycosylase domain-containing protein [Acetobacter malorum]OAG75296.1 murein transglycosylase [Acetobacter malorum]